MDKFAKFLGEADTHFYGHVEKTRRAAPTAADAAEFAHDNNSSDDANARRFFGLPENGPVDRILLASRKFDRIRLAADEAGRDLVNHYFAVLGGRVAAKPVEPPKPAEAPTPVFPKVPPKDAPKPLFPALSGDTDDLTPDEVRRRARAVELVGKLATDEDAAAVDRALGGDLSLLTPAQRKQLAAALAKMPGGPAVDKLRASIKQEKSVRTFGDWVKAEKGESFGEAATDTGDVAKVQVPVGGKKKPKMDEKVKDMAKDFKDLPKGK